MTSEPGSEVPRQLIVEADGGSRGNPGPAAYGALVRDRASGRILVELADHIGNTTNNVAEYRGLVAGLEAAVRINPDAAVECRLDSKLVVEQMSGHWAIRNAMLRPLALRAKALAPAGGVVFTWVPRAQNKRADALANESLDAVAAGRPGTIERWLSSDDTDIMSRAAEQAGAAARAEAARTGAALVRERITPPRDTPGLDQAGGTGHLFEAVSADDLPAAGVPIAAASGAGSNRIIGWAALDEPTRLLLVRHGVTQHSIEHRFSGRDGVDPPLIPQGEEQARAVAEELANRGGADVLLTSPMKRARQTAGIIARRLGLGRAQVVPDFAEAGFGLWEGLTFAEVKARWPDELTAWLASPDVSAPGGESYAQLRDRVDRARREVVAAHPGKRVLVVAHVSPIKAMVQRVLEAPAVSAFRIELAPCSLTTLGWWADGGCTIYGVGEVGHLRGVHHPTA